MRISRRIGLLSAAILSALLCWMFGTSRQRQVVQALTSPKVAIALWRTCPEGRGQGERYEQTFWRSHHVYRLACEIAPCGIDTPFAVAVSRGGGVTVLSGNEGPIEPAGAFYEYAETPLQAFNSISRQEGVKVDGANVEEYLRFFAEVYVSWGGVFVPDTETLDEILATEWGSSDDALSRKVSALPPVFTVKQIDEESFSADGYTWWYWIGEVYHFKLRVKADGTVSFSTTHYGTQPGLGSDVALRTQH